MAIRAALLHPFGLTVLVASVLLVPAVRFLPGLESFSRWVLWALPLGFVAYVSSVIALRLAPPEPRRQLSEPELVELDSIRKSMTAQLEERRAAGDSAPSELTRMLSEAIDHLDTQVRPALEELLEKQAGLGNYLDQYESGELPLPEPSVLDRLKRIHDRQRAAIDECVQQASNAAGTLVALLQEGDDARIAAQARAWANELSSLYDAIAEVLRGEDDVGELAGLYERAAELPEVTADTNGRSSREEEPEERGVGEFRGLVEEALRQLNNPYALSTCEFVDLIPATLAATRSHTGNGTTDDSTPLEQAQALRQVLVSAVDHLKPPGRFGPPRGAAGAAIPHIARTVRAGGPDPAHQDPPQHRRKHLPPLPAGCGLSRGGPPASPGRADRPRPRAGLAGRVAAAVLSMPVHLFVEVWAEVLSPFCMAINLVSVTLSPPRTKGLARRSQVNAASEMTS